MMIVCVYYPHKSRYNSLSTRPMQRCTPSRKKPMFTQQFLHIVLIFKSQLHQLPLWSYYLLLFCFLLLKHLRQGNTLTSVIQYSVALLFVIADLCQLPLLENVGVGVAVLGYVLVAPVLYTLPDYGSRLGLRENYAKMKNGKEVYWAEWYPVAEEDGGQYKIKWAHTIEHDKMAQFMNISNRLIKQVFQFFTSSVGKYQLTFNKGTMGQKKGTVIFSHGRGATPFFYSSIFKALAREWQIVAPQHSEVRQTNLANMEDIKKFREIEVKHRAQELVYLASRLPENESLVLMGHSYGCATALQAYHLLPLSTRKRVSNIVLLDPWLFPLPTPVFNDEIVCPVLMLATEHFLAVKDVYTRNLQFIKRNEDRILYICWKGGDHLHQTDMGFIMGTSLGVIKNAKLSWNMLDMNVQAIEMFLQCKKIDSVIRDKFMQKFGEHDLGVGFKPVKWNTRFTF